MKILITGTAGLAQELALVYKDHTVSPVSRSTGHDIHQVAEWGRGFLDHDCVFNCAYDGTGQQQVLEYFYQHWKTDPKKIIVTIGSRVITQPRAELDQDHSYWSYRLHKQTLQLMHDAMCKDAKCDIKIINPGAFRSSMVAHLDIPKFDLRELATKIKKLVQDPAIKRIDLWL